MVSVWEATDEALARHLACVDLDLYARTRNLVDGAVSRLSPFLTHGFITVPEVIEELRRTSSFPDTHKFVYELAWREYFHHVWGHRGNGIFEGFFAPPGHRYQTSIPEDILCACTGVKVIDETVKALYFSGYVHNHARMWLASYMVHFRKIHWLTGADWMYGYLLDGDIPSNHLSWQWVAGTLTGRPYLFNAENVARYAPALASPGTAIDHDYDECRQIAVGERDVGPEYMVPAPVSPPALMSVPPEFRDVRARSQRDAVTLMHPWALRQARKPALCLLLMEFHDRWPWSELRWRFLRERLSTLGAVGECISESDSGAWLQRFPDPVMAADHPVYDGVLARFSRVMPVPRHFPDPKSLCRSFSVFWNRHCINS